MFFFSVVSNVVLCWRIVTSRAPHHSPLLKKRFFMVNKSSDYSATRATLAAVEEVQNIENERKTNAKNFNGSVTLLFCTRARTDINLPNPSPSF